jgi:hypothetical protein
MLALSMACKSTTCPACSGKFLFTGYEKHLQITTNPQCHRIYQQQLAYIPDSDPAHSTTSLQDETLLQNFGNADIEMEEELTFQYDDDALADMGSDDGPLADLGSDDGLLAGLDSDDVIFDHYFADENLGEEDADSDDGDLDDEALSYAAELELGWEPNAQAFLETDHVFDPIDCSPSPLLYWPDSPSPEPDALRHSAPSTPNKHHDAEYPLHQDNVRVEYFPGPLAGTPVPEASTQHA